MDEFERCSADKDFCRECGKHVYKKDRKEKYVCPYCGANTQCRHRRVKFYETCKFHGAPRVEKNYYGGGSEFKMNQSQFPITRLASRYQKMKRDGRFLSNRESINLIRQRMVQLMDRIEENKDPDRVQTLFKLWERFKEADALDAFTLKKQIDAEFQKAYDDYKSWDQMERFLDLDRKMVESEVKIAKDLRAIMTAEDAYQLTAKIWASVIDAVRQAEVTDKKKSEILKRIEYEIVNIIGDESRETESGDEVVEGTFDEVFGGSEEAGVSRPSGLDGDELLHPRDEE